MIFWVAPSPATSVFLLFVLQSIHLKSTLSGVSLEAGNQRILPPTFYIRAAY